MAQKQNEILTILTALKADQEGLAADQKRVLVLLGQHSDVLCLMADRVALVLEKLYPEETGEGPSLQELLAELVNRTGDSVALLRRIDRRTESISISMPDDVVRAMKGGSGANGKDPLAAPTGHGANGVNGKGKPS